MKTYLLWKRTLIVGLMLIPIAGCVTAAPETLVPGPTVTALPPTSTLVPPSATPVSPTNTPKPSCEELEGICMELVFDGGGCGYEGPTTLKAGSVALIFLNESEGFAAMDLLKHTGEETIQDMIDYFGEEPSTRHHPSWSREIPGVWGYVNAEESHTWRGSLQPGIYSLVCVKQDPNGVWFGTGLTVESLSG